MLNQIFLSYRHESLEHARGVRRLGELLRESGLNVVLDQFYLEAHPGGPDDGWAKWCEDQATESACVIICASLGWFDAYNKVLPPGPGAGAASEADLFRQALWDDHGRNARLRVAFLHELAEADIPVRLRPWHRFKPFAATDELTQLVRWAAQCLGLSDADYRVPTVAWPAPMAGYQPDLADRTRHGEWPAIVGMLSGGRQERILLFHGGSGLGKSALIRESAAYARKLGLGVTRIDFKGDFRSAPAVLGQLDVDLGGMLPNFSAKGGDKFHLLQKDLRALQKPVLVLLDTYEHALRVPELAQWLEHQLLPEVAIARHVAVIVAGQGVPAHEHPDYRDVTRLFTLHPIAEEADWRPWIERKYPGFAGLAVDVKTLVLAAGGVPGTLATCCDTIARASINPAP